VTNARTTTRDPGSASHQPAPSSTSGASPTPDRPAITGCALKATSRIHNRAGIPMPRAVRADSANGANDPCAMPHNGLFAYVRRVF
jgi:hypothetical protein